MPDRAPKLPLAAVRRYVGVSFSGTAVINRPGWISDGMGGGTATFASVGTVACTISTDGRPQSGIVGYEQSAVVPYSIDMPHDADVATDDRVVSDGVWYEIIGTSANRSQSAYLRITAVRMYA